jgi:hypothetical protein
LLFPDNPIQIFCKEFNKKHAKIIKSRCAIYKEELIAAALHPNRVERWLEAGFEDLYVD